MDLQEREAAARLKIKTLYGTPEGEYGPTLYVSHHLEVLDPEYWLDIYDTDEPEPEQILDDLVLVYTWSYDDDGVVDVLDFSLPEEVTNYVLAVRFRGSVIIGVDMES